MSNKNSLSPDEARIKTKPKLSNKPQELDSAGVAIFTDDWWLELGPVDLSAQLVTIQRGTSLVAAITPRDDGRLRVAVYPPLAG